jgi:hypothetical protein
VGIIELFGIVKFKTLKAEVVISVANIILLIVLISYPSLHQMFLVKARYSDKKEINSKMTPLINLKYAP